MLRITKKTNFSEWDKTRITDPGPDPRQVEYHDLITAVIDFVKLSDDPLNYPLTLSEDQYLPGYVDIIVAQIFPGVPGWCQSWTSIMLDPLETPEIIDRLNGWIAAWG